MTLRDLRAELSALNLHELTPVNASGLSASSAGVCFSFDQSDIEFERDELKERVDLLTSENSEKNSRLENIGQELKSAMALLVEVKAKGAAETLADHRNRAEQAELKERGWYEAYRKMDRELTALRKRKGIGAGLVANGAAILGALRALANGQAVDRSKAAELYSQIQAYK